MKCKGLEGLYMESKDLGDTDGVRIQDRYRQRFKDPGGVYL